MAVYQVGADGKAPKGLQVGDEVVTGGGTVRITGVNADGSYTHDTPNTAQTTKNYTGSYANGNIGKPATVVTSPSGKTTGYGANGVRQPANVGGNTWSGNGASGYTKTMEDYARDTTDYAAKMLASQSYDEFKHWESKRNNKAAAQGINLSGGGVDSNEQLYQQWKENVWPTTAAYAQYQQDKANAAAKKANPAYGMQSGGTNSFAGAGNAYGSVAGSANISSPGVGATPGIYTDSDIAAYLEEMFAQNLQADLDALKYAFDENTAELEHQNDVIAEQYRAARNQAAAQNALQKQQMNEYALASGLNTGTSGQAALAQSAVYQGNLGNLWAQEAQNQAEIDMQKAQLRNQYNRDVNQATANSNALLSQALYEEMVRQEELRREAAAAELKRQNEARDFAYDYAMTMLSAGAMPDANTLQAAGILGSEADALYAAIMGNTGTSNKSNGSFAPVAATPTPTYDNGSLTPSVVATLQADINKWLPANQQIAVDGKWGAATAAAAGGMTADEYANIFYKQNAWSGRSDR